MSHISYSFHHAIRFNALLVRLTSVLIFVAVQGGLSQRGHSAFGQAPGASSSDVLGSQFVPSDAIVVGEIKIAETLNSSAAEMYPIEIVDAWAEQNLGIAASSLESLRVVLAAPGPGEPQFGAVLTSSADIDLKGVSQSLVRNGEGEALEVNGRTCFGVVDARGVVVYQHDARTIVVATQAYLDAVVRSAERSSSRGTLARLAESNSPGANATILSAIEPVRPMATGMLQAMAGQIPPPLQPFANIPSLLDAIVLRMNLANTDGSVELNLLAVDKDSASQLGELIGNGLEFGRQMGLAQMAGDLDPNDPMADATRRYMERLSGSFVQSMMPRQEGSQLKIELSPSQGLATQGVLVGLLLPAVQSARTAARRVSSMNNLKQVGLAMHNSHDVYRKFPGDIVADDGTPLLSWRVAILPFIEQSQLYDQFKKDEPWDSPHNLKLLEQMPNTYQHPGMQVDSGQTVYQRPVGKQFIMEGHGGTSMREILDGTSNTIMVVESPADAAVPWTKPSDLKVDLENLLGSIVGWDRQGLNVLFADGSVRYIAATVDLEVLKALLTRNGAEVIGAF